MRNPLRRHPPDLALALQGGGAHGAFTWGVLDALLEDCPSAITAVSGASAGAMNAIVLAHGLQVGGRDGARAALASFWTAVAAQVASEWWTIDDGGEKVGLTGPARLLMQWAQFVSPYQSTMKGYDPLRKILTDQVDFERLGAQTDVALFIAATHANTGRLRLFRGPELTVDAALASACLPTIQRAIVIDGQPYWDGAYSANPAIFPLLHESSARDLLLVMLTPHTLGATPQSVAEIRGRAADIAFNASFLREMRSLAEARERARRSLLPWGDDARVLRLRWHLIDGHDALVALPAESKMIARLGFLERLRDAGRLQTKAWLADCGDAIGDRSSLDLCARFGGDA
jgi:NTE family protein